MFGLWGKIVRVNLAESKVTAEDISEDKAKKYLGGSGLATRYLYDEVPKGADPLGPDNKVIIMTGPLTGLPSPSAGRYNVTFKSPLTNGLGNANSGGFWASKFKQTGFDGVIFEGISPKPVYLVVEDDKAELRDASFIWGKGVTETTRLIGEKLGKDYSVLCIGPAGENLVRYANVMNDEHRAAGRGGGGTVMGSKQVKAIAVKGTRRPQVGNEALFREATKKQYDIVESSAMKVGFSAYGTSFGIDVVNNRGGFPTRNWQTGVFPEVEKIGSTALCGEDGPLYDTKPCFACPIRCGRLTRVARGPYAGESGEGPEYETTNAIGGMNVVTDIDAICAANYRCNDLGLDTITAGSSIAFATECYEKGLITKADTDGIELKFGDAKLVVELIEKIGKREGFGDFLAEGTRRMADKIGKGSEAFAMNVKGLELPGYDSRAAKITGLAYATANRGGDHITAFVQGPTFFDMPFLIIEDSKIKDVFKEDPAEAKVVKDLEEALTAIDAAGACKFMGLCLDAEGVAATIAGATGFEFSKEDFQKVGERIYNLARAFNIREGMTRADDTLPKRLLEDPLPEGPAKGHVNNLAMLLDPYYELRGWDKETGKPTQQKLKELGLDDVIKDIWG